MADFLTPAQRSAHMSRIRSKDTKPELRVRRLLHSAGYRFRTHLAEVPGRPDVAFTAKRKLIQVNGCFWHDHQGCPGSRNPKSNSEYWTRKLARNRERDHRHLDEAHALGWEVMVVWECELNDDAALKSRLADFLGHPRSRLLKR